LEKKKKLPCTDSLQNPRFNVWISGEKTTNPYNKDSTGLAVIITSPLPGRWCFPSRKGYCAISSGLSCRTPLIGLSPAQG
jgi:hypothetical protein